MKILLWCLICFSIASCTNRSIASLEKHFLSIGMSKDEIIANFGIPTNVYKSQNIEVWEYHNGFTSYTSGDAYRTTYSTLPYGEGIYLNSYTNTYQKKVRFFFENDKVVRFNSN